MTTILEKNHTSWVGQVGWRESCRGRGSEDESFWYEKNLSFHLWTDLNHMRKKRLDRPLRSQV